jgi:hypothetical protein
METNMPSPFPGMDPYLEAPASWTGVQSRLINDISELLVPQVKPTYLLDVESRVFVLDEDDPARRLFVAEAALVETGRASPTRRSGKGPSPVTAVVLMLLDTVEVSEPRLVIRDARGGEVVTVIEVLSPTNKTLGSRGREEYLSKRRELLRSNVHLIEIDLLRAGARIPSADPLPPCDSMAHLSRVGMRPRGEVFAWTVRAPAPVIPVPLRSADADVMLDLGATLRRTYERGGHDAAIDYARPPEPPLRGEDAAWAAALLRERGIT